MADERAEARLAAAAVDLLGELGALERERDLRGERPERGAHGLLRGRPPRHDEQQALRSLRRQVEDQHAVVVDGHAKRGELPRDAAARSRPRSAASSRPLWARSSARCGHRMQHA